MAATESESPAISIHYSDFSTTYMEGSVPELVKSLPPPHMWMKMYGNQRLTLGAAVDCFSPYFFEQGFLLTLHSWIWLG